MSSLSYLDSFCDVYVFKRVQTGVNSKNTRKEIKGVKEILGRRHGQKDTCHMKAETRLGKNTRREGSR